MQIINKPSARISLNFLGFVESKGMKAISYLRSKLLGISDVTGAAPGGAALCKASIRWFCTGKPYYYMLYYNIFFIPLTHLRHRGSQEQLTEEALSYLLLLQNILCIEECFFGYYLRTLVH